jgi:Spy/CpxP family protein refolding chaperone
MKNWKRIVAPLLVFFLGVLFGVGGSVIVAVRVVRHFAAVGPHETVQAASRLVQRRLDLTPAQRAELAPVFAAAEQDFERLRREDITQARRAIEAAVAKIRPALDAKQRKKLDEWLEAPRARWTLMEAP